MKIMIALATFVIALPTLAADIPPEAHPGCMDSLKMASTSNPAALKTTADQSAECQALPPEVVKFLIKRAASLARSQGQ